MNQQMITSTKSIKTILAYNIALGALCAFSSAAYGFSSIGTELALHPSSNNGGFVFGYTCLWPFACGLWIWANSYAFIKLNKLRNEILALRAKE
jgi:hypothetical protein